MFQRSIRFGENVSDPLPTGRSFFLDIGTRHIIPLVHTLFCRMNSVILASVWFRVPVLFPPNVKFDYFFISIVVWNEAKEVLRCWHGNRGSISYGIIFSSSAAW